jgi:pimeloyl-ACP methyl ester carboxylesterase
MNPPPHIWIPGWAFPKAPAPSPLTGALPFDFHPHGSGSATAPSPYARALAHLLEQQAEPAILNGWSTGALIALETAHHWPDHVRALHLFSSTACFSTRTGYPHGQTPAHLHTLMDGIRSPAATRILRRFIIQTAAPHNVPPDTLTQAVNNANACGREPLLQGLHYLLETDLRPLLHSIRCPVRLLHGTEDAVIPFSAAEHLAEKIPHAQLIALRGQGHGFPLFTPQAIPVYA